MKKVNIFVKLKKSYFDIYLNASELERVLSRLSLISFIMHAAFIGEIVFICT